MRLVNVSCWHETDTPIQSPHVRWHETDMTAASSHVRSWGAKRKKSAPGEYFAF
jgi:hypothetical protein